MEATTLKSLVIALLAWINLHAGYEIPPQPPEIEFVPKAQLEQIGCAGPCPILAWFPEDPLGVIYVLEGIDVVTDVCGRAILVHELVHYAQGYAGTFSDMTPRERTHFREMEALQIQNLYLAEHGRRLIFGNGFGIRGLPGPYC